MPIGDVVAQKEGAGSLSDLTDQLNESGTTESDAATQNVSAPQLTLAANGTTYTLSTQALILYGIVLADILLLCLVWKV